MNNNNDNDSDSAYNKFEALKVLFSCNYSTSQIVSQKAENALLDSAKILSEDLSVLSLFLEQLSNLGDGSINIVRFLIEHTNSQDTRLKLIEIISKTRSTNAHRYLIKTLFTNNNKILRYEFTCVYFITIAQHPDLKKIIENLPSSDILKYSSLIPAKSDNREQMIWPFRETKQYGKIFNILYSHILENFEEMFQDLKNQKVLHVFNKTRLFDKFKTINPEFAFSFFIYLYQNFTKGRLLNEKPTMSLRARYINKLKFCYFVITFQKEKKDKLNRLLKEGEKEERVLLNMHEIIGSTANINLRKLKKKWLNVENDRLITERFLSLSIVGKALILFYITAFFLLFYFSEESTNYLISSGKFICYSAYYIACGGLLLAIEIGNLISFIFFDSIESSETFRLFMTILIGLPIAIYYYYRLLLYFIVSFFEFAKGLQRYNVFMFFYIMILISSSILLRGFFEAEYVPIFYFVTSLLTSFIFPPTKTSSICLVKTNPMSVLIYRMAAGSNNSKTNFSKS